MKPMIIAAGVTAALAATALTGAASANAATGSASAPDVVAMLQDQGYDVQFNGSVVGPLSRCSVTGVHGLTVMAMPDGTLMMKMDPANPGTVYVDVTCPIGN